VFKSQITLTADKMPRACVGMTVGTPKVELELVTLISDEVWISVRGVSLGNDRSLCKWKGQNQFNCKVKLAMLEHTSSTGEPVTKVAAVAATSAINVVENCIVV